ncbi:hypothetical protein HMPREF1867_01711 [Veillonella dispar]|nr:hypothetical protein HMPREF1867_01711 [Veillonella dispar]
MALIWITYEGLCTLEPRLGHTILMQSNAIQLDGVVFCIYS